jgi:hypothetical protein
MPVWSYHQWFRYIFVMLPVQEWVHCSPWYTSRYHCNYHIGEWSSRTKIDFSHFPCHTWKQMDIVTTKDNSPNLDRRCHCWFNSYEFGVACFDNDSTYNDVCHSKQDMILHKMNVKRWFHSLCHKNLQLSPSSIWFLSNFLCTCLYSSPSSNLFGTFNAYISL